MKRRINVDRTIQWPILVEDEVRSLVGLDLRLTLRSPDLKDFVLPVSSTAGNVVSADFPISVQPCVGSYHLTLWINYGKTGQCAVDAPDFVELVSESGMESDDVNDADNDMIEVPVGRITMSVKGEKGDDGVTFTPHTDDSGDLWFTNNGGLENPARVNLKGPIGEPGQSVEHGFEGTVLTITSASGTTSVDLQGPEGKQGYSGNMNWPRMEINENMELVGHVDSPTDTDRIYVDEEGYLTQII